MMKRQWMIGAILAPFVLIAHALAYDVSITPGTGGLGFDVYQPPVPVPEPSTFWLVFTAMCIFSVGMAWIRKKRGEKAPPPDLKFHARVTCLHSDHDRFSDRAIYSTNPKVDPLA